ncbi:hypothetical protein FOA52_012079 [Chlamydomonas sp. UWO 241]|nr:hypothetical protein FOA52_012079 [Chlamydomonas sp. UWO 241]
MDRRWQKEGAGRYATLQSFGTFCSSLPDLGTSVQEGGPPPLCDAADLYAVYSALHAKGRTVSARTCTPPTGASFIYFLADGDKASKAAAAAVASARGDQAVGTLTAEEEAAASGRQELVVPVSSKHTSLSLTLLHEILRPRVGSGTGSSGVSATGGAGLASGPGEHGRGGSGGAGPGPGLPSGCSPGATMLAIVDDDNSVSLLRCFNYVQPPLEGPEAGGGEEELGEGEEGGGGEEA